MHGLDEAERFVGGGADGVVDHGIGSEFGAALVASPLFGRRDQRAADTQPPERGLDVPALEYATRSVSQSSA